MGMFDTIIFPEPIACYKCGMPIHDTQTKQFENCLITYELGDIFVSQLITGIIKETLFCQHGELDNREEFSFDQEIFIAIWRNIYVGIFDTIEGAEEYIYSFSKPELINLYNLKNRAKSRYKHLYTELKRFLIGFRDKCVKKNKVLKEEEVNHFKSTIELLEKNKYINKQPLQEDLTLGDLYLVYQDLYKEVLDNSGRYRSLKHWSLQYVEFLGKPLEEQFKIKTEDTGLLGLVYFSIRRYLTEEEPLQAYINEIEKRTFNNGLFL